MASIQRSIRRSIERQEHKRLLGRSYYKYKKRQAKDKQYFELKMMQKVEKMKQRKESVSKMIDKVKSIFKSRGKKT